MLCFRVQVDDADDFCDGPDSEYETDDSNGIIVSSFLISLWSF